MGLRRPRTLLLGATVLVAVLLHAGTATSQPVRPGVVHGAVDASGQPIVPVEGWQVGHPFPGTYRIDVSGDRVDLDVSLWDAVAQVTVLPLGHGSTEVRISEAGIPVDSAFSFVTVAAR